MHCVKFAEINRPNLSPDEARDFLTAPLARFLLTAEARRLVGRAGLAAPVLPTSAGSASVLLVWKPNSVPLGVFAPSFVLPLNWKKGEEDSRFLPDGIAPIAESVRKVLGIDGWGLWPSTAIPEVNLRDLTFDCGSIWAPLATSLYIAAHGGEPSPHVFATGSWSAGGIDQVRDIPQKVEAVLSVSTSPGTTKPVLFVPKLNESEALSCAGDRLTVLPYPLGEGDVSKCLETHLAELEAPPAKTAPFQRRIEYSNRSYLSHPQRQKYYLDRLIDSIAESVRESTPTSLVGPVRLAIGLGKQPVLPLMILKALRPVEALVLYTEDTKEHLHRLEQQLIATGGKPQPQIISLETFGEVVQTTEYWLRSGAEGTTSAVDITVGTKLMTACVVLAAERTGTRAIYLEHDYHAGTQVFGSEKLVLVE